LVDKSRNPSGLVCDFFNVPKVFFFAQKFLGIYDKYHILPHCVLLILSYTTRGMSVIYLLISISIIVAVAFLYAFLRAVKTGQYDDDYTPSVRMLFDDELVKGGKRVEGSENLKLETRNPKSKFQIPKPKTLNLKPETRNRNNK
jgi:cbb3-type cytochrome oxidase maturation protein